MGKQITDLTQTNSFDNGDLLLVRKSAAGVDNKIAQADFIKSIGNTAIDGFVAVSNNPNELTLSTVNGVTIDAYYEGMIISFISPIASTGLVKIQIGALALTELYQYGTTNTILLEVSDYVTAIYTGTKFYQTNMVTNTIYTNEYIATGVVAPDQQSTTYDLASAIGANKIQYYRGMSSLFTTDVASKGAVLLNIDGLGLKNLTDQVGDNVPFNLSVNETVMAIYNGTNFIKNIFSTIDPPAPPIDPENPVIPPENKETIIVGPAQQVKTISEAVDDLIRSYGEDGGNRLVNIELDPDYIHNESFRVQSLTPWITIVGNPTNNGNIINTSFEILNGAISFTGTFRVATSDFIQINKGYFNVKNAEIKSVYGNQPGNKVFYYYRGQDGTGLDPRSTIESSTIDGFDQLIESNYLSIKSNPSNIYFKDITCTMTQGGPYNVIRSFGQVILENVNFGNINRPNGYDLLLMGKSFDFINVNITTGSTNVILSLNQQSTFSPRGSLKNCTIRNTTNNAFPAVATSHPIAFDGGDYRHPNSSSNIDIQINAFPTALCTRTNGVLASFGTTVVNVITPPAMLTDV